VLLWPVAIATASMLLRHRGGGLFTERNDGRSDVTAGGALFTERNDGRSEVM
jgi:hypothetical protein